MSLLSVFNLACCFYLVSPFCVLRQDCPPGEVGCYPRGTTTNEKSPFPLVPTGGVPVSCPQYASSGCCTPAVNSQLFLSYVLEENTLGEPSQAGCPACAANVQALWCAFACSPMQSEFLVVKGMRNVTIGGQPPQSVLAVVANLTLAYAQGLFTSCSGVGLIRSNPVMDTIPLFLKYMGEDQGVATAKTLVEFTVNGPGGRGLDLPLYDCCNFPSNLSDPGATGNTSCPCASCLGVCPGGVCSKKIDTVL